MQDITLWEGNPCPLCLSQGINSKLKFFRLNLRVAALLCKRKKCPFPLSTSYPDTFVRVGKDGMIIPGSQSERGWSDEGGADSDDSPYISDASEESVTFPDTVPEVKKVSSENRNEKGALEVDAFDINSIDFETDDSMDTFKLRNEITSLEMEITKSVENMKSVPPPVKCNGSSVLHKNSKNSGSLAGTAFTSADGNVCPDTQKELDVNCTSCVKINENCLESCNYKKSDNIILREHDSPTGISGSLELTKTNEELAKSAQQPEVNTPTSIKSMSEHKRAEFHSNSNRSSGDGVCNTNSDQCGDPEDLETISNGNYSDMEEMERDMLSLAGTSYPGPRASILLTPQDTKNIVGNELCSVCNLNAELVNNESATFKKDNICEKEMCDKKEVITIFDDQKNSDSSDNNARKPLDTTRMADASNLEPEPSVLLSPQSTTNTVGNVLPRKHELLTELVSSESVIIKEDNDCWREGCDNKEVVIVFDDHKNMGQQFDTISMASTSNPEPEQLVLSTQSTANTVGNGLPRKHELLTELVSSESGTIKEDNDCEKEMHDKTKIDIIFKNSANSEVYEIVAIDNESSTDDPKNSKSYEVINLQLRFVDNQNSSGGKAGRKTTKLHHSALNTIEELGKKSSVAHSHSVNAVAEVEVEDGIFMCTTDKASSGVSGQETEQNKKTSASTKVHSKMCVCFLCKKSSEKGITSHLDRALADIFPEEHSIVKQLTERDLPTEKEVMRNFIHYMTGNSLQNTKRSPKKRKRLFHL